MSTATDNQDAVWPAMPTIHRLPGDVLCEIFEVWADVDRPARDHLGFIHGSHVCRSWRAIMLDLPPLWANNICAYHAESVVGTFLERARGAPLALDFSAWNGLEIVKTFVSKHPWSRARVIVAMWPGTYMDWGSLLSTHALLPNLRTLKIGNSALAGISAHEEGRVDTVSAPSLKELHMRNIRLTVNAPTLRFLTLELLFPEVLPYLTVPSTNHLPELLRMIAHYPMLELLNLMINGGRAGRHADFDVPPVLGHPVSLPHLRVLKIRGGPATVALIWKNTDIPQHAAVSCDLNWHSGSELMIFFESVRTLIHRPENHALFLGTDTRTSVSHPAHLITCFISSSPVNEPEPCSGSCSLKIDIPSPVWRGVATLRVLKAVTSTSPHIESLTLHNTSIGTEAQQFIVGDLALLTKIKHLRVKGDEALAQLRTLLPADALADLMDVDIDLESNDDWRAVINLLRIRADSLHPLDSLLLNGAIMYWDEAEQREESSLLEGVSGELHDKRKVIWKSSVDLSSLP